MALYSYFNQNKKSLAYISTNCSFHFSDVAHSTSPLAFDPKTYPCWSPPPGQNESCSCTDCEAACTPPDFERYTQDSENIPKIYLGIVMIAIFGIGILVFLILIHFGEKTKVYPISSDDGQPAKGGGSDHSIWSRSFVPKLEEVQTHMFYK